MNSHQLLAYAGGPPDGYAGNPPNNRTCVSCHNSFALNSGQGSLALTGLPEAFESEETYRLTLNLQDPTARRWGFELTIQDANNDRGGNIGVVNAQTTQLSNPQGAMPQYLKHRSAGTFRGQANGASWEFDWTAPGQGVDAVTFYLAGNAANNNGGNTGDRIYAISVPLEVFVPQGRELTIALPQGWSMMSLNVVPGEQFFRQGENRGPDVIRMLEALRIDDDAHGVILFKDEGGRFYSPAFGFTNIPYWNLAEGYQINMREPMEAVWEGDPIPADAEISIAAGWNIIAYYPDYPLDASAPDFYVLSPIIEQVIMAKNDLGQFMSPAFRFSNMEPWRQGKGYQVNVSEAVILRYPADE